MPIKTLLTYNAASCTTWWAIISSTSPVVRDTPITLATASFIRGKYAAYSDYLQTLSVLTDDSLLKFAQISPYMLAGMHHCARGDFEKGARSFETLIAISDEDAYYLPAIRCMLGLSYRAQDAPELAREQFSQALERALEINVYPAMVGAAYELNRLDHPGEPTATACERCACWPTM